jgi:hypothetical protein
MGSTITDTDKGYKKMLDRIYGTAKAKPVIRVGILEKDGAQSYVRKQNRAANENGERNPMTIIQIAVFNEFGTATIPERSFIRAWFDENNALIKNKFSTLMRSVVKGDRTKEEILDLIGLWCVGNIQQRISAGIEPENADSTIKAKGSSTPLIDTGILRSSVSYEVEQ